MDGENKRPGFVYKNGDRLGRYDITNPLYQIGFKDIYLGQQIPNNVPVMIEVFRPPLIDALKQTFLDRAQALMKLKHPNILPLRDAGVRERYPFLVIDKASYLTLRQVYLQGSIQPLAGLLPHLKQIASALQYMHNQRVLHGGIQPENILLDGNNNVLLWGFAFEALTQNRELLNFQPAWVVLESAAYAAPEQIQEKAEPASDQYSLAILIYELLCGALPFTGTALEVANQQMHMPPPSLRRRVPAISERIERVIMKALEKDPRHRFINIQAFIDTLEQEQFVQISGAAAQKPATPAQPTGVVAPPVLPQPVAPKPAPPATIAPVRAQTMPGVAPTVSAPRPLSETGAFPLPPVPVTPVRQNTPPAHLPPSVPPAPVPPAPVIEDQPPARRRDSNTITRRAFAVGLVGLAAAGGVGGWYFLQQKLAKPTLPGVGANTTPPATRTTINNTNVLVFSGHLASVNAVAWSPDGRYIASASDDTYVQIFNATTGKRKLIYSGHTEEVAAVAWSPNGTLIASGGQDTTVQVWNFSNGARILTYRGHTDRVNGVSWSSNSRSIASGSEDKTVQVWNAANAALSFNFRGHTAGVLCVGWQPNDSSVASGSWDGTLRDWATVQHGDHFNAGDQIFDYGGHGDNEVSALAWSPDGAVIASAGADQTVQISNGVNGTPRPPFFTGHENKQHPNPVLSVAWSPDGTSIASGDSDGNVLVWKYADRTTFFIYRGHKGAVNAVAWSPDGKFIASASADNTVQVWQPG